MTHYPLPVTSSAWFAEPSLLCRARQIYQTYLETNLSIRERPSGVVINRRNYRGYLAFTPQPILLPDERFIPYELVETILY